MIDDAGTICSLLEARLERDHITIREHGLHGVRRMDLWAVKRSWTDFRVRGYEIKITRRDFVHDSKMEDYLRWCTELWLVTPWGLIDRREVPEPMGLMWVTKNGSRIVTKKRADRREMKDALLAKLAVAALWKSRPSMGERFRATADEWREWLENRQMETIVGRKISAEIHRRVEDQVAEIRRQKIEADRKVEAVQHVLDLCEKNGFDLDNRFRFRNQIEDQLFARDLERELKLTRDRIDSALKNIFGEKVEDG